MNELIEMLRSCGNKYCADCPDVEECAGPGYLMLKAAEELERLKESEPVVHAHWVYDPNGCDWGIGAYRCSRCDCRNGALPCNEDAYVYSYACAKRCPHCGAHMDEEATDADKPV